MTVLAAPNPPELGSSRKQARELLSVLPRKLAGHAVVIDCAALLSSAPSFVDELVKVCLVDHEAEQLVLRNAPERLIYLAQRSAGNRAVRERLIVQAS